MDVFLKMKHWHLFLLFAVLPLLADAALERLAPAETSWLLPLIVNGVLVFLAVAYLWTLGMRLYRRLAEKSGNLSPGWFRAGLVFVFAELVLLATFAGYFIPGRVDAPYYLTAIHVVAMVALFYAFYFVAKSLAGVEKGEDANLNDFAGYFFMLWFYPIGIWFFQPKVNRVFGEE